MSSLQRGLWGSEVPTKVLQPLFGKVPELGARQLYDGRCVTGSQREELRMPSSFLQSSVTVFQSSLLIRGQNTQNSLPFLPPEGVGKCAVCRCGARVCAGEGGEEQGAEGGGESAQRAPGVGLCVQVLLFPSKNVSKMPSALKASLPPFVSPPCRTKKRRRRGTMHAFF